MYFSGEARTTLQSRHNYAEASWGDVLMNDFVSNADIIIVRFKQKVNGAVLKKFPQLKIIFTATTGTDHIDVSLCNARNIIIWCLKPFTDFLRTIPSTAEHTIALMLSLVRNVPKAHQSVLSGTWNRDLFFGSQLKNKTLGIIGLGRTGSLVAKFAAAFGMSVVYYDPYVNGTNQYQKVNKLNELLQQSDIVSLHVHLNKSTELLLNNNNCSYIKPGAYIINTSRGKIVDESLMVKLLEAGILKGMASDVISNEHGWLQDSALYQGAQRGLNIILTPHIGGATLDALHDCEFFLAKQLVHWVDSNMKEVA